MTRTTLLLCFFLFSLTSTQVFAKNKSLIGETAWIQVGGESIPYLARVDTGARTTSLHAVNLQIASGSAAPDKNIGKMISFQTMNREGKAQTMSATIVRVSSITNSQGTEQRYEIELPLSWKHIQKTVRVNLRDRSKMTYKLLIGRNWLSEDFLVDVDIKADNNGKKQ